MNKSKLRVNILIKRKKNKYQDIKLDPNKIFKFLKKNKLNFKNIGGYYPYNYEIDDMGLLNFFKKRYSIISLPIIKKNYKMDFYKWSNNEPLKINKYGIAEPSSKKKVFPDLIFIPLVAYDKNLNRLGYGGGFYDRYIQKVTKIKKITKIGLAFSFQEIKNIPTNNHDQKLDFIITEKGIIK